MTFVLDASIAVSWAFPDEHHPTADSALDLLQHQDSLVPTLWWFEVRNALLAGERRGRIDGLTTGRFLQRLARLPVTLEHEPDESVLIDLTRRHRLTVYDTAYLELALRHDLTLATLDGELSAAARTVGVALLGA